MSSQNEKKIHWAGWDKLAYAKCVGGLGFRGVGDFNVSLLGKYVWEKAFGKLSGMPLSIIESETFYGGWQRISCQIGTIFSGKESTH